MWTLSKNFESFEKLFGTFLNILKFLKRGFFRCISLLPSGSMLVPSDHLMVCSNVFGAHLYVNQEIEVPNFPQLAHLMWPIPGLMCLQSTQFRDVTKETHD